MKHIGTKLAALAALGLGSSLVYARGVEPYRLRINHLPVLIYDLAPAFDGYRIVHFSDIHVGSTTMTRRHLARIVAAVNAQQPDLIAFTGDFVTHNRGFQFEDLTAPLSALCAPDGVVATLGNHDKERFAGLARYAMRVSSIVDLSNAVHVIRRGDAGLHVAGVDSMSQRMARLDLVLEQLPDDAVTILLAHEPDFADISSATNRFALQLSGHSHGGQIRLPLLTKYALPVYGQRYSGGTTQLNEMVLHVSRGVGTVGLPLRFNCPPEISVITLRSGAAMGIKLPTPS